MCGLDSVLIAFNKKWQKILTLIDTFWTNIQKSSFDTNWHFKKFILLQEKKIQSVQP